MQPSEATVTALDTFVKANNLEVTATSPHGEWVTIKTTVGQANKLFGAKYETFVHTGTSQSLVRTLSVSLPSELADHVDVVHPTTAFVSPDARLMPVGRTKVDKRAVPASCNSTITPACLSSSSDWPASCAVAGPVRVARANGCALSPSDSRGHGPSGSAASNCSSATGSR